MANFIDLLDDYVFGPLNLIDRIEGMIRLTAYHDSGVRFSILRLDRGGKHSRPETRALLKKYGIASFGITHDSQCVHFLVKRRQAKWAEYLLLHAGVELQNPPVDPNNAKYYDRHEPGWMPTPWSTQKRQPRKRTTRRTRQAQQQDGGGILGTLARLLR